MVPFFLASSDYLADSCFLPRHELDFLMHGNIGAFGSSVAFILQALSQEPLA
jgi:hypothetical protein